MEKESTTSTDKVTWCKKRSQLERILLLLTVVLAVIILGFLLYLVIKPFATTKYCESTECLIAASEIVNHMNPTVDPCDDFFKFVCGKLIRTAHPYKNLKSTPTKELDEQVQWHISEIIQEPMDNDDHYMIKNEKKLFQACMDEEGQEEESLNIIKETLNELNGWPVAVGKTWDEKLFYWSDMIIKLKRRGYEHSSILSIDSIEDSLNGLNYVLHISGPRLNDLETEHRELYKNYMADVAVQFGADQRTALEEMEKVIRFQEKLEEISTKNRQNLYHNQTSWRHTVREFQKYNTQMNWLEFINGVLYPVKKISIDDYVVFPTEEFVNGFFNLIFDTPKRVQANYIIWHSIENLMPYLSEELKQLYSHYHCLTNTPPQWEDRFELCKLIIFQSFVPVPTVVTYARRYLPVEKRRQVQDLARKIKSEFVSLLEETSWMDAKSKQRAMEKAEAMVDSVGIHGDYFHDAFLEQADHNRYRRIQGTSFLHIYLGTRKNFIDTLLSRIHTQHNTTKLDLYGAFLAILIEPFNLHDDNVLIYPVERLEEVFQTDRPTYLNYGNAGFMMGHEITKGFTGRGSLFDKDGNPNSIWTKRTGEAFEDTIKCIALDFDAFFHYKELNRTMTIDDAIADITGLKVAYKVYKEWIDENGEESQLIGIDYTPKQLFWISAMSYKCFDLDAEELQDIAEQQILNSFQATAAMRHNHDFAQDFNCPVGSKMNPKEKCQVF